MRRSTRWYPGEALCMALAGMILCLAAAPAAATPITSGLLLWLRADQGFTSGPTTTWTDQSSYGSVFSSTIAGRMPVLTASNSAFNNQPTIQFDGNDYLPITSAAISGQQTAFFV